MKNEIQNKTISRRRFIKGAVAFALVGNGIFEYGSQKLLWNEQITGVDILDNTYNKHTQEMSIVLAGLGQKSGHDIAQALSPTLSNLGPVTYSYFADSGFGRDFEELPILASKIKHQLFELGKKELTIYAHSMGGTIFLNLLPHLRDVYIRRVILDCSPFTLIDARSSFWASGLAESRILPLGVESKLVSQAIDNLIMHPNSDLTIIDRLKDTYRQAVTGVSPVLSTNQIGLLKVTNPYDFKNLLHKETQYLYLMPMYNDNDDTVNVDSAFNSWEPFLGGSLPMLRIPKGGHANPTDRTQEYNNVLSEWFANRK